jgi:homoserine dehydrogenase
MTEKGLAFDDALKAAQKKGYAEADPTLDIGGGDTGHKLAIVASLLYGGYVPFHKIYIEGITQVTAEDIAFAKELGYSIKLLGIITRAPGCALLDVRVHPTMLHRDHILSSVTDVFNAILIEGDAVGPVVIYGKGAGEMPTASAVVGDIIDVARNIAGGSPKRVPMNFYSVQNELPIQPIATITTRYYLRFSVVDKPKVLAAITSVLGEQGISIASVMQKEGYQDDFVPVIILTHEATEASLQKAVAAIEKTDFVKRKTQIIRIEE